MIKVSEIQQCYYVPGQTCIIDTLGLDGLTSVCKESITQVLARQPKAELWDFDKACEEIRRLSYEQYISAPVEIDSERFYEMLEVLPPMKWRGGNGQESFMISEALTMDIRSIYCRIGDRYFEMADKQSLTHEEIAEKCKAAIAD